MAKFTATAATDSYAFTGTGDDFLYFQFDANATAGDVFDGGEGRDTIQIRSSMVAHPPGGGTNFIATDEDYDFTGITFRSFEVLSYYPMARMDMPGEVILTSDQFGAGLISNRLELVGSDYSSTDIQKVTVNLAAGNSRFDASGWTFATYSIGTLPVKWTSGQDVIALNGSAGGNTILGTTQSDLIDGLAGIDTVSFAKLAGAVTVRLNGSAAAIATIAGGNPDTLRNIENLIGSAKADHLSGDAKANRLDGGAGADTLAGGAGNDTYVMDRATDRVIEALGGGTDTQITSVSLTLAANVEMLVLTGTANLAGSGNALANTIIGNAGNNSLAGKGGADAFVFAAKGFGRDTITDFTVKGAAHDRLRFDDTLFATRADALDAAIQRGADVVIQTDAAADQVILKGVLLGDLTTDHFAII